MFFGTGPVALLRDIRLSLSSNATIRAHARSALINFHPQIRNIAFGLILILIMVIVYTVIDGITLTAVGGIVYGVVCIFWLIGSTYRGSRQILESEFQAVQKALENYRAAITTRADFVGTGSVDEHTNANTKVSNARTLLFTAFQDLQTAEACRSQEEREAIINRLFPDNSSNPNISF